MDTRAAWLIDIDAQVNEHILHLDDQHLKSKFKQIISSVRTCMGREGYWPGDHGETPAFNHLSFANNRILAEKFDICQRYASQKERGGERDG